MIRSWSTITLCDVLTIWLNWRNLIRKWRERREVRPESNKQELEGNGQPYLAAPLGYPARLLGPNETYDSVTDKIGGIALEHPHPKAWWTAFLPALGLSAVLLIALSYLLYLGVGIWGINIPVAWGFAIVNFVW